MDGPFSRLMQLTMADFCAELYNWTFILPYLVMLGTSYRSLFDTVFYSGVKSCLARF